MNDSAMTIPGRSCPLHYRYTPAALAQECDLAASCIYIVGGLYGNLPALDAIDELAAQESAPPVIIFNGDFNWFNVDQAAFTAINSRVLAHTALRGNVETELAGDDPAAGCGCGYPDFVGDAEVARSNQIIERLRDTARRQPLIRRQLAALPMYCTAVIGTARIAIVHGDCESLAGWGLSREALAQPAQRARVKEWFTEAQVNVIASSHSCLPVMLEFAAHDGLGIVVNNGAAGMPNFAKTRHGVITRIGLAPSPHQPIYGAQVAAAYVDALAVHYDTQRWHDEFHANWLPGSPAHMSYSRRIENGPHYRIDEACRLTRHRPVTRRPVAA
jgi:hypothetical protein